jgi:hypothetical protein
MVRFKNATVKILEEKATLNKEGDYIAGFVEAETIVGDVQPHALTEDEIKAYGISTARGDVKIFLYNGLHPNVKSGNRASVTSTLSGDTKIYSIMPVNCWTRHGECLLIPVENEE